MDALVGSLQVLFNEAKTSLPNDAAVDRFLPPDVLDEISGKVHSLLAEYATKHTDWQR